MKKVRFSLNLDLDLSLFRAATLRECYSVVSPTNPPWFAGGSLRTLSSIDHNGQRLAMQESIHRKDFS